MDILDALLNVRNKEIKQLLLRCETETVRDYLYREAKKLIKYKGIRPIRLLKEDVGTEMYIMIDRDPSVKTFILNKDGKPVPLEEL